jgi:hypothetical protein
MEDTRSAHCIRTPEHEQYKRELRGMSLDEFTQALCVWRPHWQDAPGSLAANGNEHQTGEVAPVPQEVMP